MSFSDDESERIRRYTTVTRYGKKSVPTVKTETDREEQTERTDSRQNRHRQNRQTTENMAGVN